MIVLGLDPGDTTGYALVEIDGKKISPIEWGDFKDHNTDKLIELIEKADEVVSEAFLLRPGKAKQGAFNYSKMPTAQQIGQIKLVCQMKNKKWSEQPAAILPVGCGFANIPYKSGVHLDHWKSAFSHVVYYCVKQKACRPIQA